MVFCLQVNLAVIDNGGSQRVTVFPRPGAVRPERIEATVILRTVCANNTGTFTCRNRKQTWSKTATPLRAQRSVGVAATEQVLRVCAVLSGDVSGELSGRLLTVLMLSKIEVAEHNHNKDNALTATFTH